MEEELKRVKAELKHIRGITPDDNLRYLINQITVGNIEVSEKDKVLVILGEVDSGILNQRDKISELQSKLNKTNKK